MEGRARPPRTPLLVSALLPGAGHVLAGRPRRGLVLLAAWVLLVGLGVVRRARIAAVLAGGAAGAPVALDGLLAVATLAALLAALWAGALADVRGRGGRAEGQAMRADSQWALTLRDLRSNRLAMAGL